MSKVMVYSKYREGVVVCGRDWDKDGVALLKFRQFRALSPKSTIGHVYMSPEEAMYVVESKETRQQEASGEPSYWYPQGLPIPVQDDHDGPFLPAISEQLTHVTDSRQSLAAQEVMAERAAAMKAKQDEHNEMFGSESGTDAPQTFSEPQTRNGRNRAKANAGS